MVIDSYYRKIKNTRVVDGDTIECTIDLGFNIDWNLQKMRLKGVNTPERKQPGYQEAKDFTTQFLAQGEVYVNFPDYKEEKYGRDLAMVYVVTPQQEILNLNQSLLDNGLAVPFMV
jgi:micrococcal nuclease